MQKEGPPGPNQVCMAAFENHFLPKSAAAFKKNNRLQWAIWAEDDCRFMPNTSLADLETELGRVSTMDTALWAGYSDAEKGPSREQK